jgi:hypothetical protein
MADRLKGNNNPRERMLLKETLMFCKIGYPTQKKCGSNKMHQGEPDPLIVLSSYLSTLFVLGPCVEGFLGCLKKVLSAPLSPPPTSRTSSHCLRKCVEDRLLSPPHKSTAPQHGTGDVVRTTGRHSAPPLWEGMKPFDCQTHLPTKSTMEFQCPRHSPALLREAVAS